MYGYVREVPPHGYRSQYIDALRATMLKKHRNTRLFAWLLPADAELTFDGSRRTSVNNDIEDEIADMSLAEAQMIVAHRANNPDALDEAIDEAEEVLRRARDEANELRNGQARLGRAS